MTKPRVGLRATHANEVWHIDTTVIRVLDGTRAYVHAVIDNFSRRILAWRVADTFASVHSVAVLLDAGRRATGVDPVPVVLADAGVENVNAQIDALIASGVLRRVLAHTELRFSNSMIEAWWRSLKHQWLFLHPSPLVSLPSRRESASRLSWQDAFGSASFLSAVGCRGLTFSSWLFRPLSLRRAGH